MKRSVMAIAVIAGALVASATAALSQSAYCERLRADIAALDRAPGASGGADAVRQQRAELDRTVAYARSIGCQRQRFLIFGEPPPAQCGSLEAQINRMESNLAALEGQRDRYGMGAVGQQRAALMQAFDANCRGLPPSPASARNPGFLERLFGPDDEDPVTSLEPPAPVEGFGSGTYRTLCVRKCDGYYFPISNSTTRARFDTDSSLCQASCPNAEVELFLQPANQDANAAVALDGTSYTSLPNAFRYRKALDPGCTCRRPGQSWAEALADAERMLADRRGAGDIIVTEEKAQELSRPKEPTAPAAAKGKAAPAPKPKAPAAQATPPRNARAGVPGQ
ncbi:DUF2865 domain-containing protein [uncultured Alsobacter sp.]|uniref:DUF2865 domain-containing protein n=1 Tax=uncultured Alsobacter sp. TaxID=1748258 RepID=UPI0025E31D40|nr:DUF2865 domain-containing protein [uncultured Alsobacter sp.]